MKELKLYPEEVDLLGRWIVRNGQVVGDETCQRIKALTSQVLVQLATDSGGWDTLFRDPRDGRFWERTYPQGEYHGGGPPRLAVLSQEEAQTKYCIPDGIGRG